MNKVNLPTFLANIKRIEQVIIAYDNKPDNFTIGELRKEIIEFTGNNNLNNQWWGLLVLLSLIPLKNENFKKNILKNDAINNIVWFLRDCLAHDKVEITENEFLFIDKKHKSNIYEYKITYAEFPQFIKNLYIPFINGIIKNKSDS